MPVPDIELIISRNDGTVAALQVKLATKDAILAEDEPITINEEALRGLAALPDAYGGALSGMIFVPALREAWREALGYRAGASTSIRVRLTLRGDDALHALRWELLRDPITNEPLAYSERVRFSRYLNTSNLDGVQVPSRPNLQAVIAVANPAALPSYKLQPIDVLSEVARAQTGLGDIPALLLDGQEGRSAATLPAIADALRGGAQVLYLVCHGTLADEGPLLWLDQEQPQRYQPTTGDDLVQAISRLEQRPLLVVLASCQGAGDTYRTLAAVGPKLARFGVGAVIAMQGNVPVELVTALTPRLFSELRRDGQIDRALAAARSALSTDQSWWMPVLWMVVRDGALWRELSANAPGKGVFQVPYPPNPLFRGRDAELAELASLLLGGSSTTTMLPAIAGTGGIGKTQLASEFAHRYREQFPGGVFWLDMSQPDGVAAQVAAMGGPGGLDLPSWAGMDFSSQVTAVRRAWSEPSERLLIFDNLEEPRLLQEWRPVVGGTRVLVTTRRGIWSASGGVQPIRLHTLDRAESVRLLLAPRAISQAKDVEEILTDSTIMHEAEVICEQIGDLPLALALAGAYLEQTPNLSLASYHILLGEQPLAHPSLAAELEEGLPTRHAESVAATIALSYMRLDPQKYVDTLALMLLHRAATLAPTPIPHRLLVRLVDRDPDSETQVFEVDAPLRQLASVGLIEMLPNSNATIHRLVAAFARNRSSDTATDTGRVRDSLNQEIISINEAGYPQRGQPYLSHLQIVAHRIVDFVSVDDAVLLNNLGRLLYAQGDYAGAQPHLFRALSIFQQVVGANHPDTATILNNLGLLLKDQGDYTGARTYLDQALLIRERSLGPQHPATASSLNNLGALLYAQGDLDEARPYLERALAINEQVLGPQHPATASSLNNMGALLHAQDDLNGAQAVYERALSINEQILGPQHPETANSLNNLGALMEDRGRYIQAQTYFQRALAINEQVLGPQHPSTALSLNKLGYLLKAQGDYYLLRARRGYADARPYLERALTILTVRFGQDHPTTQMVQRSLSTLDETLIRREEQHV